MTLRDKLAGKKPEEAEAFIREILRAHKDSEAFEALNLYLSGLQSLYSHIAFTPNVTADTRSFATGGLAAIDALRRTLNLAFASSPVTQPAEEDLGSAEDDQAAEMADKEIVY